MLIWLVHWSDVFTCSSYNPSSTKQPVFMINIQQAINLDGKCYKIDCIPTENATRAVQSAS